MSDYKDTQSWFYQTGVPTGQSFMGICGGKCPTVPANLELRPYSLSKLKIFLVNPKQIATQMFLGFLWRTKLPR